MQRSTFIAIAAAVLVLGGGAFLVLRHLGRISEQMAGLSQQVEDLSAQATAAEGRALEAETRANQAEAAASEAAESAKEAMTREQESAEKARQAEQARQKAEELKRLAVAARQEAELLVEDAEVSRQAAERKRAAAEEQNVELARDAELARASARRARAEAEKIRRRMEEELDQMEEALGRIAETRRTALGLVMTLDSSQIEFDVDEAELRPENREVLSLIAGVLLTHENYGIQIFGHTDDVGTVEHNQELSERRAEAVRNYLVEAGIDPSVLSTTGLGKSSPLVEGTDEEARQRNRRVELAIVLSEEEYGEAITDEEAATDPG